MGIGHKGGGKAAAKKKYTYIPTHVANPQKSGKRGIFITFE